MVDALLWLVKKKKEIACTTAVSNIKGVYSDK